MIYRDGVTPAVGAAIDGNRRRKRCYHKRFWFHAYAKAAFRPRATKTQNG